MKMKKQGLDNLECKAVLAEYLCENTFDDLLLVVADLAHERGIDFTFYQAR